MENQQGLFGGKKKTTLPPQIHTQGTAQRIQIAKSWGAAEKETVDGSLPGA